MWMENECVELTLYKSYSLFFFLNINKNISEWILYMSIFKRQINITTPLT